jgi:hypothetical protein
MTSSGWDGGLRGWYVTELPKKSEGNIRVAFNYTIFNFTPEKKETIPSIEPVFYSRKLVFVCDTFTRIAQFDPAPSAENIAKGQQSAQEVVEAWLKSPGHRKNILAPHSTRLGVGKVGSVWVQNFGR